MITCVVDYVIDPAKIEAFERFGRRWIELNATGFKAERLRVGSVPSRAV